MRRTLAVLLVVASCGGGAPSLSNTLGPIPREVDETIGALHRWLDAGRDSRANLYETLSSLETTTRSGDLYDRVSRLDESGLEADLGRYTRFVGDLLLASGSIDGAIAEDRFEAIALSWLRVEAGAGALAVGLDPEWCLDVSPSIAADLCRPPEVAPYDAGVEHAVRLFLARYRPVMRLPRAFGDGVRSLLAVTLAPEVVASIDEALAEFAELVPPDARHRAMQEAFIDHLLGLREVWETVPATQSPEWEVVPVPGIGDVTIVRRGTTDAMVAEGGLEYQEIWPDLVERLIAVTCDHAASFAAARSSLRAAFPASTLPGLGALWFYGEGIGCPA